MTITDPFLACVGDSNGHVLVDMAASVASAHGPAGLPIVFIGRSCVRTIDLPFRSVPAPWVVADRSLSMPHDSAAQQKEAADIVHSAMGAE